MSRWKYGWISPYLYVTVSIKGVMVMVSVHRNGICPCGSGREYKMCHGAPKSKVIQMDTSRYEFELERLESALLSFAWDEYEEELTELSAREARKYNIDDPEVIEILKYGLLEWTIFNQPYREEILYLMNFIVEKDIK